MFMHASPLPSQYISEFSTLYHLTSINSAFSILNSLEMKSLDPDGNASFSVLVKRPDIARHSDVCLRFKWEGAQAVYFGIPFGYGEPKCDVLEKPVLYHIFSDEWPDNWEGLKSKKYWQTNLYPGNCGLIFDGIEAIHVEIPPIPSRPSKLCFWNYRSRLAERSHIEMKHQVIDNLKYIAIQKIGKHLCVSNK